MACKLMIEVIEKAIQAYAKDDNGYCLKFDHFASFIEPDMFDKLEISEDAREGKELDNY